MVNPPNLVPGLLSRATRLTLMIHWRCTVCGFAAGLLTATCVVCGGHVSAEIHPHLVPVAQIAAVPFQSPDSPHLHEPVGAVVIPGTDKAIVAPPPSGPVHRQRRPVQARLAAPARGRVGPMGLSAGGSMGH